MITLSTIRHQAVNRVNRVCKFYWRSAATSTDTKSVSTETKPFSEIPGPGKLYSIPYIGTALMYKPFSIYTTAEIQLLLAELRKKCGDIYKLRMGHEYWVIISHPDFVKSVFLAKYAEHPRMPIDLLKLNCKEEGIQALSIALRKGKDWETIRKPAQEKMLRPAVVASYIPFLGKIANDFIVKLKTKDKVDHLVQELANYTTESVGMLCFNRRLQSFDDTTDQSVASLISETFALLHHSILMPVKSFLYFKTKLYKQYENLNNKITQIVLKEISSQKEILSKKEQEGKLEEYLEKEPNFLHSLLTDPRISIDDICALILDLFRAGVDSVNCHLSFQKKWSAIYALQNLCKNGKKPIYEKLSDCLHNLPQKYDNGKASFF